MLNGPFQGLGSSEGWTVHEPWLLPITSDTARMNFVVVGIVVAALALYQVRQVGSGAAP